MDSANGEAKGLIEEFVEGMCEIVALSQEVARMIERRMTLLLGAMPSTGEVSQNPEDCPEPIALLDRLHIARQEIRTNLMAIRNAITRI